jgi:hypothetical protein
MVVVVMGILSTILGAGDVVKKGLDLIDDMHTSKEEEIAAKSKAKTDLLNAYAPFKIAQRFLALMFGATFLLSFVLVLGMTLAGVGDTDDVRQVLSEFYIGEIMGAIVLFYFGGGAFEGAFKARAAA